MSRGYDRLGRLLTVVQGGLSNTLLYNDARRVLSENYAGGLLANLALPNRHDNYLRRGTNVVTLSGSYVPWSTNGYDAASRLATVGDHTFTATNAYLANSPLASTLTFKQSGVTKMTTSKQNDSSVAQSSLVVEVSTRGTNTTSTTGHVFLAKSPEVYYYDPDGNLLSNGMNEFSSMWHGNCAIQAREALWVLLPKKHSTISWALSR